MRIDFPREEIPINEVRPYYEFLLKQHMHYMKMQARQPFAYMIYTGFFLLVSFINVFLENKGFIFDYRIGVVIFGIGTLLVMVTNIIFISSDIDWKSSCFAEEGRWVEERYKSIINSNHFNADSFLKNSIYKVTLFSRLCPFVFVSVFTSLAAVALSMKISTNLAVLISLVSTIVVGIAVFFLQRMIKKRLLFLRD